MLAALFTFLGSALNLVFDTVFKIGVWIVVLLLGAFVIFAGFAVVIIWLVT